jgi:CRP-like cAMP-binding protein
MGEYVVKEGTLIDRIYWVQRGKISVSRSIDLFDNGSMKSTIFNIDTIE